MDIDMKFISPETMMNIIL